MHGGMEIRNDDCGMGCNFFCCCTTMADIFFMLITER